MSDMDQKQHKMYVGTGVGAALFYYSSERPENPAEAGATTSGWISTEHHEVFGDCPWTLELCSICYDMMLKDQKVLVLSCTHRFHQACVLDWLEEQPTCPNCRRPVRFH